MDERPPIHEFWYAKGDPEPRLKAMADLRDYVEGLPETRQLFKPADVPGWDRQKFTDEMLVMVGSWEMPEPFASSRQNADQWINPNYVHRERFPASWGRCKCGAILSRGYDDGGNRYRNEHDHSEDCLVPDRLRARAEMLERRREVLLRGLRLGRSGRQLAAQIGIRAKGLGEIAKALNVSIEDEKQTFRRRAGRTYVEFLREGIRAPVIADAYGVCEETMQRRAKKYTDYEYDHTRQKWVPPYSIDNSAQTPPFLREGGDDDD